MVAMNKWVGRVNYIAEKKENGSRVGMLWENGTYPKLKYVLMH